MIPKKLAVAPSLDAQMPTDTPILPQSRQPFFFLLVLVSSIAACHSARILLSRRFQANYPP